jgi:hypothetical protein
MQRNQAGMAFLSGIIFCTAGATWWLESLFGMKHSYEDMLARIQQGIPFVKKSGLTAAVLVATVQA